MIKDCFGAFPTDWTLSLFLRYNCKTDSSDSTDSLSWNLFSLSQYASFLFSPSIYNIYFAIQRMVMTFVWRQSIWCILTKLNTWKKYLYSSLVISVILEIFQRFHWTRVTICSKILALMLLYLREKEKPSNKMGLSVEMKTFKGVKHKNKQSLTPSKEGLSTGASDKEKFPLEVQLGEIIGSVECWVSWPGPRCLLGLILYWATGSAEHRAWLYMVFAELWFISFWIWVQQAKAQTINIVRP